MATEKADPYSPPRLPHQAAAPSEASKLPRIGGKSPGDAVGSFPRLDTRNGEVIVTKGGGDRDRQ